MVEARTKGSMIRKCEELLVPYIFLGLQQRSWQLQGLRSKRRCWALGALALVWSSHARALACLVTSVGGPSRHDVLVSIRGRVGGGLM